MSAKRSRATVKRKPRGSQLPRPPTRAVDRSALPRPPLYREPLGTFDALRTPREACDTARALCDVGLQAAADAWPPPTEVWRTSEARPLSARTVVERPKRVNPRYVHGPQSIPKGIEPFLFRMQVIL